MGVINDNSGFLHDEDKTQLGIYDLYDRVVNLKLYTTAKDSENKEYIQDTYVIRSDFEPKFHNLEKSVIENNTLQFSTQNSYQIVKCNYKPSIKVQYKRVSMSTPVSVDIYIHNFFMLDRTGKMLKNFNNLTNQLSKIELAMGYFGQFENSLKPTASSVDDITMEDLFDFSEERLNPNGITLITISDVAYVQTDSLPPDMVVHIHGYVGNYYSPSESEMISIDKKGIPDNYLDIVGKNELVKKSSIGGTYIENLFFNCVTKNWTRQGLTLDEKNNIKGTDILISNAVAMTVKDELTEEYAKEYGILVYFSNGARKFAEEWGKINSVDKDISNKVAKASTALEKANAVLAALALSDELMILPIDTTGNLLCYLSKELENIKEMLKGTALEQAYKGTSVSTYWKDKLPAVYNITTDALCTINCPFFFFINPFQKFYFKTRYALGGMVSYYANFNATEDEFYALWQTVSFATVENVNECTIVCTGSKKEVN